MTLAIQPTDLTDAAEMSFSNTNAGADWSAWEPYATTRPNWPLAEGADGVRTVHARLRDAAGNVSASFSDSIVYETSAPTVSPLVINGGAAATTSVTVNLAIQSTDLGAATSRS